MFVQLDSNLADFLENLLVQLAIHLKNYLSNQLLNAIYGLSIPKTYIWEQFYVSLKISQFSLKNYLSY